MPNSSSADNLPVNLVKKIFRKVFAELLGESSLSIMELRLRRVFGEDPYSMLCRDPARFSSELKNIIGSNADNLLRIAAGRLADDYALRSLDARTYSKKDDEAFLDLLFEAARKAVERIAPGAVCLAPHDAEIILKLLELAKAAGGVDEQISGGAGWAAKIKSIIILGIRCDDEMIPVALYSRRYARLDAIARRWLEETSLILREAINELETGSQH